MLGFLAYVASALWSAIFIGSLPMDEDAVVDAIEIQTGDDSYEWRRVEFKNSLEELKYDTTYKCEIETLTGSMA